MMRPGFYTGTMTVILVTALLLLFCTGPSEPQLAGGTGAGNPGVTAFRVVADDGNTDSSSLGKAVADPVPDDRALSILDDDSLPFTIREAFLIVDAVGFVKSNGTDTVWIPGGDYQLNLLDGTAEPELDSITIPEGTYSSIVLAVKPSGKGWSIRLGGTFTYNDSVRPFLIQFPFSHVLAADVESGTIPTDKEDLTVELDASRWLTDIDLGRCIQTGAVEFDPDGSLRLTGPPQPPGPPPGGGPCRSIEGTIRRNVVGSARTYGGPPKWMGQGRN